MQLTGIGMVVALVLLPGCNDQDVPASPKTIPPAPVEIAGEKPEFTDYCQRLEQKIQGRKHGFLAGNVAYYIGGFHASWKLIEDETLGLTHPFHHDLRSRGVGLLESEITGTEHTGTGNDYRGWEF